jgi:hypothetical protein
MSAAAIERPASLARLSNGCRSPAASTSPALSASDAALAAAIVEGWSSANCTGRLVDTMQLVEPRKEEIVPNHILETSTDFYGVTDFKVKFYCV